LFILRFYLFICVLFLAVFLVIGANTVQMYKRSTRLFSLTKYSSRTKFSSTTTSIVLDRNCQGWVDWLHHWYDNGGFLKVVPWVYTTKRDCPFGLIWHR